jgi:hypothetical protein
VLGSARRTENRRPNKQKSFRMSAQVDVIEKVAMREVKGPKIVLVVPSVTEKSRPHAEMTASQPTHIEPT